MTFKLPTGQQLSQSIAWNLLLLTVGSLFFSIGATAIAARHGFLTGGLFGTGLLVWYATDVFSPAVWYLVFNVPMFVLSWLHVGRSFFLYSLYGTLVTSLFSALIEFTIPINGEIYAAVAAGVLCGAGTGICLRSMGSGGGLDVIGIMLNRRFNIGVGRFGFAFNACLFLLSLSTISMDLFITSIIQIFISTQIMEYVLRLFSQRKVVFIISERGEEISEALLTEGFPGATVLRGKGGYSGGSREILLTVTNKLTLRRLEAIVFEIDPKALYIVENTFYVSGASFKRVTF
jgi:uncharacterized membrane-anchored protein YitT (DUF2179 family)